MALPSNNAPSSTDTSSTSGGIVTPSTSNDTVSHTSAAVSNYTIADDNEPHAPSYALLVYLAQPATSDGPVYGRLVGQLADEQRRIAFHTARAQRAIQHFDERFGR